MIQRKAISITLLLQLLCCYSNLFAQEKGTLTVPDRRITADFNKPLGSFNKVYNECVGAGRASEGLRADWQQQLLLIKKEIGFRYIRFHGLLNDDMHVYAVDKQGKAAYNWQYLDKLYDFLLSAGIKPFVEIGFMPPDMSSGTKTVFWWKGNVTPPKSYGVWDSLVTALVHHFEDRYGRKEVETWYFEVWNEPDLGGFFAGTQDDYFKLYASTVNAIKAVSKTYRVGGPATARNPWITPFLKYCADNNLPVDFVSTHSYNTKSVLDEFGLGKRRLVGQDYLPEAVKKVRRMIDSTIYKGRELHYTEFNSSPSSRDPIHDTYQNAAWLLSILKRTVNTAKSMSYWTFTDIFEEAGPAMTPFHGGFGLLNLQSIKKPTFYSYKFLSELGETELINSDSNSWVCKGRNGVQVLFWNMHLPFNDTTTYNETFFRRNIPAAPAETASVELINIPNGNYEVLTYLVGYHQNDPYSAYLEMGSPYSISLSQEAALKKVTTGEPVERKKVIIINGKYSRKIQMRENDIYFIKLVKLK